MHVSVRWTDWLTQNLLLAKEIRSVVPGIDLEVRRSSWIENRSIHRRQTVRGNIISHY